MSATPTRDFLDPPHRLSFLWAYVIRSKLLEAVRSFAGTVEGRLLDVGCGRQPYRSLFKEDVFYCGAEVRISVHAAASETILFDGSRLPFSTGAFDVCFSSEVFEHVRYPDALLQECRRVLKPGGRLFLTTPFVFPLHEEPYDFRRLTRFGLEALAHDAGFTDVRVRPLGGYSAAVAHVLGLYANQRLNRFFLRFWCYPLVWAIQKVLLWADRVDSRRHDELTLGWTLEAIAPQVVDAMPPNSI